MRTKVSIRVQGMEQDDSSVITYPFLQLQRELVYVAADHVPE